jgi:hypothetical protein
MATSAPEEDSCVSLRNTWLGGPAVRIPFAPARSGRQRRPSWRFQRDSNPCCRLKERFPGGGSLGCLLWAVRSLNWGVRSRVQPQKACHSERTAGLPSTAEVLTDGQTGGQCHNRTSVQPNPPLFSDGAPSCSTRLIGSRGGEAQARKRREAQNFTFVLDHLALRCERTVAAGQRPRTRQICTAARFVRKLRPRPKFLLLRV